jgi:hypothetical protein
MALGIVAVINISKAVVDIFLTNSTGYSGGDQYFNF